MIRPGIAIIFFIVSLVFVLSQRDEIKSLKAQIANKEVWAEKERKNTEVALRLTSLNRDWYVVSPYVVSSLPDAKGEIVFLGGEKLLSVGNHLGIKHPDRNRKISFSLNRSKERGACTIAGDWLSYKYVD